MQRYRLQADLEHLKELYKKHNRPSFLMERMKIGDVKKIASTLKGKTTYDKITKPTKSLNQSLKHGLKLKKGRWDY